MSKLVSLGELLEKIGYDNIKYQVLSQCVVNVDVPEEGEEHTNITFGTGLENVDNNKDAFVMWIDRDILMSSVASFEEDEESNTKEESQ